MRSYLPLILIIILLASLAFCSACTSQTVTNKTQTQTLSPVADVGLVPLTISQGLEFVSFDEAISSLEGRNIHSITSDDMKVGLFFIQGGGLDDAGNARQWIFGINNGKTNELRVYDHNGWTIVPYGGSLPSHEIVPDAVISPRRLFSENHVTILGDTLSPAPQYRDLDLRNGTYRITITSGSTSRILIFNATSGEVV
jgi:hypothetical protein